MIVVVYGVVMLLYVVICVMVGGMVVRICHGVVVVGPCVWWCGGLIGVC